MYSVSTKTCFVPISQRLSECITKQVVIASSLWKTTVYQIVARTYVVSKKSSVLLVMNVCAISGCDDRCWKHLDAGGCSKFQCNCHTVNHSAIVLVEERGSTVLYCVADSELFGALSRHMRLSLRLTWQDDERVRNRHTSRHDTRLCDTYQQTNTLR
jgi:hypothetical protein